MTAGSTEPKAEPWCWHLLGLVNPVLVITSNLLGGGWVASGIVYMLGLGPVMDWVLGRANQPSGPRQNGWPLERLLEVHAGLQCISVATLLYRVSMDGPAWTSWVAAASTGLNSGASGIIVAHELGHRRSGSVSWWVARFNLLTVLYLHFTTEHNHTHHRHVSTSVDPATARKGESLWAFLARTIPGQFYDAVSVQERKGRHGSRNPIYRGLGLQIALLLIMLLGLGAWVTAAFCWHAIFAIFLLEYINYIRHYGLRRQKGERLTEMHSWQSEERWSRWTLLELTRHPAHHLKASEPFWKLQPCEGAPSLPSGYYGCFWIALIPPLWKRIMRDRIPTSP